MLQIFRLFQTYVVEVLHVATLAGAVSGHMRRQPMRAQWSPRAWQAKRAWGPHLHAHHAHNYMRRRTNLQGQVCRLSSCMWHAGWTCWRSNCMQGRLSSKRGRRDGRSRRRERGHPNVRALGMPVHKSMHGTLNLWPQNKPMAYLVDA